VIEARFVPLFGGVLPIDFFAGGIFTLTVGDEKPKL
jgi:hypothetical protein